MADEREMHVKLNRILHILDEYVTQKDDIEPKDEDSFT
jgi:hypothetical protein